jgi:hypothetical protein
LVNVALASGATFVFNRAAMRSNDLRSLFATLGLLAAACGSPELPPFETDQDHSGLSGRVPWSISRHILSFNERRQIERDLNIAADLGVKYVRTDFWWYEVEPSEGRYSAFALDYYRWYVEAAEARGLGVVVILSGAPLWAKGLYERGERERFVRRFEGYAAQVAATVGDKVRYYQLWNEPNHFIDFSDGATDAALFLRGRRGLASRDPDLRTIINLLVDGHDGALCPNWMCDADDYIARGAGPAIDVIAIDHYPGTWTQGDWGGNIVDRLYQVGKKHGKAVGIMEIGYSTSWCAPRFNSEAGQVDWVKGQLAPIRAKIQDPAVNLGVRMEMINWFKLQDPDSSYDNCLFDPIWMTEAHFGIVRTNRSQKPAFGALKQEIARF